jgi:hypothetical protein
MSRKMPVPFWILVLISSLGMFLITSAGLGGDRLRSLALSDPPAPTVCPVATQELPPQVEPVTSPTTLSADTIYVGFPAEWIMVTHELGSFKIVCDEGPCHAIPILLKPDSVNHLTVEGKVRTSVQWGGCVYGGYTMGTTDDKNGNPLEIEQVGGKLYRLFLPLAGW